MSKDVFVDEEIGKDVEAKAERRLGSAFHSSTVDHWLGTGARG